MPKYFICGAAGSGKSSVVEALVKRGFTAYDTDSHPGASQLTDVSGNPMQWPGSYIDWDKYRWSWVPNKISELLSSDETVFLGGVASNQQDYYKDFAKIFVLSVDDDTLRSRILNRTSKDYGKDPKQLEGEIAYRKIREADLLKQHQSVQIDATQKLEAVVEDILTSVS